MTTTQVRDDGGTGTAIAEQLTDAIRKEHDAASSAASKALHHALEAGRLLAEAKQQVQHGSWESYVRDSCGIAPRTASLYLRLHRNRDRLPNRQRVADLSVRQAAKLLAKQGQAVDALKTAGFAAGHDKHPELLRYMEEHAGAAAMLATLGELAAEAPELASEQRADGEALLQWIADAAGRLAERYDRMQQMYTVPEWLRPHSLMIARHQPSGASVVVWPHQTRSGRVQFLVWPKPSESGVVFESSERGVRADELEAVMHDLEAEGLPWGDRCDWEFMSQRWTAADATKWSNRLQARKAG